MKSLSCQDARLTLQCLPLLASVRWKLWRTPFARLHGEWRARVQEELERATELGIAPAAEIEPVAEVEPAENLLKQQVWREAHAVRRAARLVPRGSCLTQAMALQLILARRGEPCSVRIGVDRSGAAKDRPETDADATTLPTDSSRFEAHAWVEWQGRVILGGDISRWKPLTIFAPATLAPPASIASAPLKLAAESLSDPERA